MRAQANLSGEQFKRVEYGAQSDDTLYAAQDISRVSPGEEGKGDVPTAEVRVTHPRTKYLYNSDVVGSNGPNSRTINDRGLHETSLSRMPPDDRHNQGEQLPLFQADHKPPYVDWMVAHKDMRQHIPALLGVAANETRGRFHEPLHASSDLSVHSAAIVDKLASKGVVAPRSKTTPLNTISTSDSDYANWANADFHNRPDISASEMSLGRGTLRSVLRHQPSEAMRGPQFEQHHLF